LIHIGCCPAMYFAGGENAWLHELRAAAKGDVGVSSAVGPSRLQPASIMRELRDRTLASLFVCVSHQLRNNKRSPLCHNQKNGACQEVGMHSDFFLHHLTNQD
jgi:hypothetical protein